MDFSLTVEQTCLRDQWREFMQEECTREYVRGLDTSGEFPHALFRKIADRGWLGLPYPPQYGGGGRGVVDTVLVFEELAYGALSVAQAVGLVWLFGGYAISEFGIEEQKDCFIPKMIAGEMKVSFAMTEPEAGSDASAIGTSAVLRDGRFVINGTKVFITGADHSERMLLVARTDKSAPPSQAFTIFMVDTHSPGLELRKHRSMGRHSPGTCEVFLEGVTVEPGDVLGQVGAGWKQLRDALERERVCASIMYIGNAQAAIDDTTTSARTQLESGKPLLHKQTVRHHLADMHVMVEAARLLTYRAAWEVDAGISCAKDASMAKLFSSEAFVYVTGLGVQIMGGHSYPLDVDVQRYFRDAKASTIAGGTSEMQRNLISSAFV